MSIRNAWLNVEALEPPNTTIRLWLDDVRAIPSDYNLWAKTAPEAIVAIDKGGVSHISLDHDLGLGAGTGYDVAKHIEEGASNGTIAPITWSVHSQNPSGAANIKRAMESADKFWMGKQASANKRVIIMRGLPGSGKSTKARSYGGTIVSADDFFMQDGKYVFDPAKLPEAHATTKRLFEEALKRDDPIVVVDNTNTKSWEWQDYERLAKQYGYTVEFDVVGSGGVPVEDLVKRNTHGVPEEAIRRMVDRWEGDKLYPEASLNPDVPPAPPEGQEPLPPPSKTLTDGRFMVSPKGEFWDIEPYKAHRWFCSVHLNSIDEALAMGWVRVGSNVDEGLYSSENETYFQSLGVAPLDNPTINAFANRARDIIYIDTNTASGISTPGNYIKFDVEDFKNSGMGFGEFVRHYQEHEKSPIDYISEKFTIATPKLTPAPYSPKPEPGEDALLPTEADGNPWLKVKAEAELPPTMTLREIFAQAPNEKSRYVFDSADGRYKIHIGRPSKDIQDDNKLWGYTANWFITKAQEIDYKLILLKKDLAKVINEELNIPLPTALEYLNSITWAISFFIHGAGAYNDTDDIFRIDYNVLKGGWTMESIFVMFHELFHKISSDLDIHMGWGNQTKWVDKPSEYQATLPEMMLEIKRGLSDDQILARFPDEDRATFKDWLEHAHMIVEENKGEIPIMGKDNPWFNVEAKTMAKEPWTPGMNAGFMVDPDGNFWAVRGIHQRWVVENVPNADSSPMGPLEYAMMIGYVRGRETGSELTLDTFAIEALDKSSITELMRNPKFVSIRVDSGSHNANQHLFGAEEFRESGLSPSEFIKNTPLNINRFVPYISEKSKIQETFIPLEPRPEPGTNVPLPIEAWLKVEAKLKPAVSPEELAKKWKVSIEVINKALDKGQKVEREHTNSDVEARQIASHHIEEDLNYYDKLEVMEKKASLDPNKAQAIKSKLATVAQKHGYKVYAVGGYVRDLLLGRTPKDLDCVAVKEEEGIDAGIKFATLVAQEYGYHAPIIFPRFGTAKIDMDGEEVEFVAPRKETYAADSRKPDVERGTLEDDARRRDFTVNALYQDVATDEIVDPTGNGKQDLKDKIIRVTDYENPDVIFSEDPLRALRAIRQSYALGFTMEEQTKEAIKRNVERLPVISQERIRDEFSKILTGPKAGEAMRAMHDIGLTKQFIPEFEETFGLPHDSEYHQETVDEHILAAVDLVPDNVVDRLVALLHDISKPAKKTIEDGIGHFYGHEDLSAEMAQKILERLKFPQDVIKEVVFRIKQHMRPHSYRKEWSDKTIRKFMVDMGDYLEKVLEFARHDIAASKRGEGISEEEIQLADDLERRIKEQKEKGITSKPMAPLLDGIELQRLFNKNPGKWIGEVHKYLSDLQLENPAMTKDEAIAKAKEYMDANDGKETNSSLHYEGCKCASNQYHNHNRSVIIGTAGFNHPGWEGTFYPKGIKESEKLLYFALHIPSVEINATAHLMPRKDVFERWAAQTPKEFIFSFRIRATKDIEDNLDILFKRVCSTIGHDRLGAISITIPQGMPFNKGDVVAMYNKIPAHAYAFDIQSEAWINTQAYDEIKECGGTIVRNHLLGGDIGSVWDYMRLPVYTAMRDANLGNRLKVFASDHVLDPQHPGEMYVYVQDDGGRFYTPDGDLKPSPNTVLELMKILKKPYKPSHIDLSILPKQIGGPSDPQTGPNNSALPSGGSDGGRIYGPMNQQEEAPVDIKRKKILKPGDEKLTPSTTFDAGVQENDGLASPASKVDTGY